MYRTRALCRSQCNREVLATVDPLSSSPGVFAKAEAAPIALARSLLVRSTALTVGSSASCDLTYVQHITRHVLEHQFDLLDRRFEYCNKHGRWQGKPQALKSGYTAVVNAIVAKSSSATATSGPTSFHPPASRPYTAKHEPLVLQAKALDSLEQQEVSTLLSKISAGPAFTETGSGLPPAVAPERL